MSRVDVELSDGLNNDRSRKANSESGASSSGGGPNKAVIGAIVITVLAGVAVGVYFALRAKSLEPANGDNPSVGPQPMPTAPAGTTVATGVAYTPRLGQASCIPLTVSFTQGAPDACVNAPGSASVALKYSDLLLLNEVYRSLAAPGGSGVMTAAGAASVQGNTSFGGSNITYECPPLGYQGNPYCNLSDGMGPRALIAVERTRIVVPNAPISIWRISFIRSGAPFPGILTENAGPFGVTNIDFDQGLDLTACSSASDGSQWGCMPNNTYINVCQAPQALNYTQTIVCASRMAMIQARTLSLKGLVYTGYGNFTNDGGVTMQPSNWHMDDNKKLLIISPNPQQFWFNATGCYVADPTGNHFCVFMNSGAFTYDLEVYNYDSRFMDYAGKTTLMWKMGSGRPSVNVTVDVWMGNSIDAAGPFPCLMYMDTTTGYYIGLDRITPVVGQPTGTYWYNTFANGDARIAEAPFPTQCGTTATKAEWMGGASFMEAAAPATEHGALKALQTHVEELLL